ncbi:MAG TPA: ribose-phosphate pyrophosphokinase [archaeon]|nr:ribose-phosphate pyrophosphokinase [archaeon]
MNKSDSLCLISGTSNRPLALKISKILKVELTPVEISHFKDGEIYIRIEESVRGKDVFIIQSTSKPVNDNLMELAIIIDAARRASAKRVTAVIPYYGYARQDRKAKPREPITAKLVANLIVAAGADRVICFDLHANQIQGFFDIPMDHLKAGGVFTKYFNEKKMKDFVVVSPDIGAAKKSEKFASYLKAPLVIIHKKRTQRNEVESAFILGEVKGKICVVIDDMIDTAGTMTAAAKTLKENGAKDVYMLATHGIFSGPAIERLSDTAIKEVIITDTINQEDKKLPKKFKIISISEQLANVIEKINRDDSKSYLFTKGQKKIKEF